MTPDPYQYVVLRCVPRVDREEFVNVGVVVYCQAAGFLAADCEVDEDRLRVLAPSVDLAAVRHVHAGDSDRSRRGHRAGDQARLAVERLDAELAGRPHISDLVP